MGPVSPSKLAGACATPEPGVLVVDKPVGPTSHDIVSWIRWALRVKAVGHCGTLDPAASGVLVVCVGGATRLVPHLTAAEKTYAATVELGRATDTGDAQGRTLTQAPVPDRVWVRAKDALEGLAGEHHLPPPAYSAVKVEGRRAYERARRGEHVELPPRPMTVYTVVDSTADRTAAQLSAVLRVSKGTYIRSLAVALGERLGVPAHLAALRRTASGRLDLTGEAVVGPLTAVALEPDARGAPRWRVRPAAWPDATREAQGAWLRARVRAPERVLPFAAVEVTPEVFCRLGHGQRVEVPGLASHQERVAVSCPDLDGLLICRVIDEQRLWPERTVRPVRAPSGRPREP